MARLDELVKQYRDGKVPTAIIAERTGDTQESVKRRLIRHLGKTRYLGIARAIGGQVTAQRLRANPAFREEYSRHMSKAVSRSINFRMQEKYFKAAWKKKAGRGSKKGIGRLLELMQTTTFRNDWKVKCRVGGRAAYVRARGIHAEKNADARKQGAIRGLRHTSRKVIGPNGERMYNDLERRVARILKQKDITYEYERRFDTDTGNGFLSIDFCVGGNRFIEVTDWDDAKAKSQKLNRKYRRMIDANPAGIEFIVVTKPGRVEEYRRDLEKDIRVLCPKEFATLLAS